MTGDRGADASLVDSAHSKGTIHIRKNPQDGGKSVVISSAVIQGRRGDEKRSNYGTEAKRQLDYTYCSYTLKPLQHVIGMFCCEMGAPPLK